LAVDAHAERHVDRLIADGAFVPNLDPERVEKDQGVERLERAVLPFGNFVQHVVRDRADQIR
jgi:hypothetical protein